jgi:hypothetical protein
MLKRFGFERVPGACPEEQAVSGRSDSLFYALERRAC